jgi:hypothetical protein
VKRLLFPLLLLVFAAPPATRAGGRHVYWRWMVPEAVVRAFEYRPEILLLE